MNVILLYAESSSRQERDILRGKLSARGYAIRVASSRAEEAKCLAPGDVVLRVEVRGAVQHRSLSAHSSLPLSGRQDLQPEHQSRAHAAAASKTQLVIPGDMPPEEAVDLISRAIGDVRI